MLKKIIRILSLVIFIFALISVVVWFFQNKNTEKTVIKEKPEQSQDLINKNLPEEKPISEEIFDYDSENSNDYIVFNIGKFNFELKREKEIMETTLVVKNETKTLISKKYPNSVASISKILFKDKKIILINYYSGGAHCCSSVIPYLIENDAVIEGKYLDLGNIDIFNGDTFFIKDGGLFTTSIDDRFAYFEMDYASSGEMFFPSYYELTINPLEFINRNEMFLDTYLGLYSKSQIDIKNIINKESCAKDEFKRYSLFASLVLRYSYGFLSGVEREKLKSELSNDWWCFPEKDLNKTENDIFETLKDNNKGDEFVNERIQEGYKRASELNNKN